MKIFIDIETATQYKPEEFKEKAPELFDIWVDRVAKDDEPVKFYKEKWPIYAEYSEVICVVVWVEAEGQLKTTKIYQDDVHDESYVLTKLKEILNHPSLKTWILVGHNLIWFDVPFLVKRYIVNCLELPDMLKWLSAKKPWEVNMEDTLKMWKTTSTMGASLGLICTLLWIPTPKDDIDWRDTSECFFNKEYERIANYCEKDVIATYEVYKKFLALWL